MSLVALRKTSKGQFVAEPAEIRFWRAVDKKGDNECWEWMGARHYKGYGEFAAKRMAKHKSHRFAWLLTYGEIPINLVVCHKCDNPPCCNPAHLFLGTTMENKQDSINKNRHARGETSGKAKLNNQSILEIRKLDTEGRTRISLAAQFGISGRQVTSICRKDSWSHI
jgi:hypothetical protein